MKHIGRRGAILGIGAGALAVPALAQAGSVNRAEPGPPAIDEPEPPETTQHPDIEAAHALIAPDAATLALLGPLVAGTSLGAYRIEAIYGVRGGAIPIVLSLGDTRFAVEILRADPSATPPAQVGGLAIYVANRGNGSSSTREEQGLGAMALAGALAPRLAAGAPIPGALRGHSERDRDAILHVPLRSPLRPAV